ncbi:MAG: RHS repeat-associated core domain-containing protein, partial [Acidobacteriota bacterium]
ANQLVTDGGTQSGTYDSAGNQTSTGTGLSFDYNAKNQTSEFTPPNASPITATYSDAGQAARTKLGATTQRNGALGLYSDTTSGTTTHYSHMPTGQGQAISQKTGTNNYSYLTDLRGSVVKLTDQNGTVKATYAYEPYGKLNSSSGTVHSPHRFTGGYYDSQTELYKFGARYYNPEDMRWTQLDPSGAEYGYIYAGADPVNFVDGSGYIPSFYTPYTNIPAPSVKEAQASIADPRGYFCDRALLAESGLVAAGFISNVIRTLLLLRRS